MQTSSILDTVGLSSTALKIDKALASPQGLRLQGWEGRQAITLSKSSTVTQVFPGMPGWFGDEVLG